jgi:hypothetical protein
MLKVFVGAVLSVAIFAGSVGSANALVPGFETQYNAARAACAGNPPAGNCVELLQAYLLSIGLSGAALEAEIAALRSDFGDSPATVAAINTAVGGTGAGTPPPVPSGA